MHSGITVSWLLLSHSLPPTEKTINHMADHLLQKVDQLAHALGDHRELVVAERQPATRAEYNMQHMVGAIYH
jgi:hypothetical protein